MESFLTRHKNLIALAVVLAGQIIGLAMQVRVNNAQGGMSLMRMWSISAITPVEKGLVHGQNGVFSGWSNYFYLRGVRKENRQLREQIEQMRLQNVRVEQDALQARRLQALFDFKEQFISQTLPAQVIGSSGSDQSRIIYLDKGSDDGVKSDMAVISPDGIVGKVLRVLPTTCQVLVIDDQLSGVGATLEKTRLQGILAGTPSGTLIIKYIMKDEKVEPGETVVTSGGDRIFPKGLAIGRVKDVTPGKDMFLNIRVTPAANLSELEEVLVVTRIVERERTNEETNGPVKAADILAARLPTVQPGSGPKFDANGNLIKTPPPAAANGTGGAGGNASSTTPKTPGATKPGGTQATPGTAPKSALAKPKPANSAEAPQP
ncbi:MAG TPA: rod shape-determining protein MreC [Candidatus Koribacter sp.]|jgi:rod shape-determining protein MreC